MSSETVREEAVHGDVPVHPRTFASDPLVRGGQGRTGDEVEGCGAIVAACLWIGALLCVLVVFGVGVYSLRVVLS